jgi:hypothetical protein
MSFPQALGSDRELILHDTRILAVAPIASRNFHGNRFHLESIPSYLQLLFAECPNHTGKKSAFYFKGSKCWYKTHNCKCIQNYYWTNHPGIGKFQMVNTDGDFVVMATVPPSIDTRTASTDKPVPTKISSVQHESFCINIYDSQITKIKKKIFYYSPITVLQHKNVAIIHKKTVPHLYVNFFISNQEVINKVLEHLSQHLSQEIELNQVKVLPYDSVRLTSKVQSSDFSLTN